MKVALYRAEDRAQIPWGQNFGMADVIRTEPLRPKDPGALRLYFGTATIDAVASRFSHFPGLQRLVAIVTGTIRLTIDGMEHQLDPVVHPHERFDGGAETTCTVLVTPAEVFNVIFGQGYRVSDPVVGRFRHIHLGIADTAGTAARSVIDFIICWSGEATMFGLEQGEIKLGTRDVMFITRDNLEQGRITVEGDPTLLHVTVYVH